MENLTKQVKRELELSDRLDKSLLSERDNQSSGLGDSLLAVDYGLEELSQQIVERLLARIQDGRQSNGGLVPASQVFLPLALNGEGVNLKTEGRGENSQTHQQGKGSLRQRQKSTESLNFQLQQEKHQADALKEAVRKERHQSLALMEKLNSEKQNKS